MLKNFEYKRKVIDKPEEPHRLQEYDVYGKISIIEDDGWTADALSSMGDQFASLQRPQPTPGSCSAN